MLIPLPSSVTRIGVQELVLEVCKLRCMFLVAVCQQVEIRAKMSQIKIWVTQAHLIKIEHL